MCENGMSPGVLLRSKSNLEPCPQNNTLDPFRASNYFKISDEHTPSPSQESDEDSDLFDWIHFMGKTISIDLFTKGWSLFVSSLPDRFQTILKWFRKRFFFLFFFSTRLWQSVTMLIGGIRYSAKANNQTKDKIESTTFPSITVWDSDRVSHHLYIE